MAGEVEDHKEVFFSTLSSFQRQGSLVDVIVEVENEEFPSHRLILSIYSPFFRAMFSSRMREEREERVRLSVLSAEQFRLAHEYMYGRLLERGAVLELQTALQLAEAANYLDMKSLLRRCCIVVMKETSLDTVTRHEPDIYEMCCRFNMTDAIDHLDALYLANLHKSPALRETLLKLPATRLVKYVCSDRLKMPSEVDVMELVRGWWRRRKAPASPEDAATMARLVSGIRFGLLTSAEHIDLFLLLCEEAGSPCADPAQLRQQLAQRPFWRVLPPPAKDAAAAASFNVRSQPRAALEVCAHVTFQDSIFTLRFCHVSGPKGVDYTQAAHEAGIPPRLCMSPRRFLSMRLHRTTSQQWHCCTREGFLFMYVEQAMEPASQAPGVLCVFDSAREVFHCFDGVTPLLSMMSIASCGECLYVMGGVTSAGTYSFRSVDSIFAFNLRQFGWSRLEQPTLPQPVHAQAAATLNDAVYVSGGTCHGYTEEDARTGGFLVGRPLDCLWRLPADASSVTVLAPMLQARYQHRLLACRGCLYAVGGVCENRSYGNQQGGIERYDPVTDQWTALDGISTEIPSPPSVRFFGPVIALEADGCIYVMGRGSSPPNVGLWQFDPENMKWHLIQLLSWQMQQMLTADIAWSCLNSSEQTETDGSVAKLRKRNHVKEELNRKFDGPSSPLPSHFG